MADLMADASHVCGLCPSVTGHGVHLTRAVPLFVPPYGPAARGHSRKRNQHSEAEPRCRHPKEAERHAACARAQRTSEGGPACAKLVHDEPATERRPKALRPKLSPRETR